MLRVQKVENNFEIKTKNALVTPGTIILMFYNTYQCCVFYSKAPENGMKFVE
jgi:hypothetical protein